MHSTKLIISERDIRRHGKGNAFGVLWRQWRMERHLERRGLHFRGADVEQTARAYAAMSEEEFEAINARQDWANWRTIPRCLSGKVPNCPLRALDLGCGTGGSTQVLAFYCPHGSHITGYELAAPLLTLARRRAYVDREGQAARVEFCCQGVTEPLRDSRGETLSRQSVDLVNASGIVGHHLRSGDFEALREELVRVLSAEGVAALDVGPTLGAEMLEDLMAQAGFRCLGRFRSWWGDPTGQLVFHR